MRDSKLVTAEEQATGRKGIYMGGHARIEKMRGSPGHKSTLAFLVPGGGKITVKSNKVQTLADFQALYTGMDHVMIFAGAAEISELPFANKDVTAISYNYETGAIALFSEVPQPYSEGS